MISLNKKQEKSLGRIPPIQLLVCNSKTRRPGDSGLNFLDFTKKQTARMSKQAKDAIIEAVHQKIFGYEHWAKVLKLLELKAVTLPLPPQGRVLETIEKIERHPTGEGEEHRLLKMFLARNPRRVGIRWNNPGETEQIVLSGDRLDISFRNKDTWICVEVKGKNSPEGDLIKGIFQCVKYQAVLEAQLRYETLQGTEQESKIAPQVLLACGGKLSKELRNLADHLNVEAKADIDVPEDFVP